MKTVEAGDYVLEVGGPAGTLIERNAEPAPEDAASLEELSRALEAGDVDRGDERTLTQTGADLVDEASAATAKVEKAVSIGKGLARGEALDPGQLGVEIDTVLGLLERLDREGRWKEEIRLARALSTLFQLLRRWAALLQSLRAALRAGRAAGDLRAVGWAKHELGTLKVVTGDVGGAARDLGEAREIRKSVGDRDEIAATDHNLRSLCERLRGLPPDGKRPRILRVSLALAVLILLLAVAGGVAGGVAGDRVAGGGGDDGGQGIGTLDNPSGPKDKLLTVVPAGAGSGMVSSSPKGIECPSDCADVFPKGKEVMLMAQEDPGSTFEGFSGECADQNPCALRLAEPTSIGARFEPTYRLTVDVTGIGTVTGGVPGQEPVISCSGYEPVPTYEEEIEMAGGEACDAMFAAGDAVELKATPAAPHWLAEPFKGCEGTSGCYVKMDAEREVSVEFAYNPA